MRIEKIHAILFFSFGFFVLFAFNQSWPTAFCLLLCVHAYLETVRDEEYEKSLDYQALVQRLADLEQKTQLNEAKHQEIVKLSEDTKSLLSKANISAAFKR